MAGVEAIKPAGFVVPDKRKIVAEMERFGAVLEREAKHYPPWRPWKNPPPTSGPRKGGRRTGQFGRGWSRTVSSTGDVITMRIANPVSYATYVQGKRQARFMAARDWVTIYTIADRHVAEFQKRMAEAGAVVLK